MVGRNNKPNDNGKRPAPATIRISGEVYEALAAMARPFESPNKVLMRLLGLEKEVQQESEKE